MLCYYIRATGHPDGSPTLEVPFAHSFCSRQIDVTRLCFSDRHSAHSLSNRREANVTQLMSIAAQAFAFETNSALAERWHDLCMLRSDTRKGSCGGLNEEDRGYRKAVQTRRGEGGAAGSWPARHHRHRSQGFRPSEGPHRTLSRRRIRG